MKTYGKSLKENRITRGKSLLDVERETGISNANLSRWETGKVLPNIDFCVILADYYEISVDELIGHETVNNAKKTVMYQNCVHNGNNIF